MKKSSKVLLGIGCGGLVLVVVVIVGGLLVMRYIERGLEERTKADEIEGLEYGKTVDQQGCVDRGLIRSKGSSITDLDGGLATMTFMDACFKNARPTQNFCAGVPGYWSFKDSEWAVGECHKAGLNELKSGCSHVFKSKHNLCSPAF